MSFLTRTWQRLTKESPYAAPAREAYLAVVAQARQPVFYASFGVPDSIDGRFEMIALHAILLVRRIKGRGIPSDQFGREFMSYLFADMDRNLREMGTGDMRVGKKIKEMAEAFYGRAKAYNAALDSGAPPLEDVLKRNIYADVGGEHGAARELAGAVQRQADLLETQELADILAGTVHFEPPRVAASPNGQMD
jgi:cytochrome b pre-mRNA-processing protein 3